MKGKVLVLVCALLAVVVSSGASFAADGEGDYVIQGGKYIALHAHHILVQLDDEITCGIKIVKDSWFYTADMDQLARDYNPCSKAQYEAATEKRTAMGDNSAVLKVKRLVQEIAQIKSDYQAGREAKNKNPDLLEHIRRSLDYTAKRESDHLIRDLARDFVDDIIWKNRRW